MQGGVASQRRARFFVETRDPEQPGGDGARRDLSGHRFEIVDAVERNGGGELRVRVVLENAFESDSAPALRGGTFGDSGRQQRGHLPTRRFAYDRDAIWIDSEGFFISANEADRLAQVLDLILMAVLWRQAVVYREPGEARFRQRLKQRRHVSHPVARLPPAAVRDDHGGKRPRPIRNVSVEVQPS